MTEDARRCAKQASRFSLPVMIASAVFAALFPHPLAAQQDERSVRAAFVYNLTKYVTWPVSARELKICVVGRGATGPALKLVVDGKVSEGRTIRVQFESLDSDLRHCSIVYWSDSDPSRIHSLLSRARGTSILLVGEDEKFVREGGMIGFVRSGDSIEIEVNIDALKAAGLKVDSRLLDLAQIVHTGTRG